MLSGLTNVFSLDSGLRLFPGKAQGYLDPVPNSAGVAPYRRYDLWTGPSGYPGHHGCLLSPVFITQAQERALGDKICSELVVKVDFLSRLVSARIGEGHNLLECAAE